MKELEGFMVKECPFCGKVDTVILPICKRKKIVKILKMRIDARRLSPVLYAMVCMLYAV